jgi:RNA polymerase sigma-70 factor (ECF subfamily)
VRKNEVVPDEDADVIALLKAGDEAAYRSLIRAQHGRLVRLARSFCRVAATAEEVVQDSWIAVFTGIGEYRGEAPLRSWIAGIVVNKARARAVRDGRIKNFSDLVQAGLEAEAQMPGAEKFGPDGAWREAPAAWDDVTPERIVGDRQLVDHVGEALERLPDAQRMVVMLRDIDGHEPAEICRMLGISDGNLRILLHRARLKLRAVVDGLVSAGDGAAPGHAVLPRRR